MMPRLSKRESGLDRVGVDVAVNVDLRFVLNRLVPVGEPSRLHCAGVGVEFIGHDHFNIFAHVFLDVLSQRPALGILGMEEASLAAALPKANDDLLCC